jgi:hypothetical protein
MDFRTKKGKKYPINARDKDKNRLNLDPEKLDNLVDKITAVYMKENREKILNDPRKARPQYMREDPTTPLIREVPFGPDTTGIGLLEHGNPKNYDHMSHSMGTGNSEMSEFDKFEAEQDNLPKDKQFPSFGDVTGKGSEMVETEAGINKGKIVDVNSWRVIPHGGISIPQEQERKDIPREKRDWEHGRLLSKSKHNSKKDKDAEEIAKELLLNEGRSKFVNKATGKIRPNKPVRSDYASIISAEKGFNGIIKKETTFKVAEHNKPEFVSVVPLKKKT